ncbi:MAG: mercuric transporter MerT family protein [Thermoanaerobaculia bacterium]
MSDPRSDKSAVGVAAAGAGAAALATAASACCVPVIAPLVVAVLGAGGAAWAAGLKPYSMAILAAAGLLLAYGYWVVYRPRTAARGEACPVRRPLTARLVLWLASALWAVAAFLNLAPGELGLL